LAKTDLVTIPEAARRLGLDERTFRRHAVSEIPVYDFGDGAWPRMRWSDVDAWWQKQRRSPTAQPKKRAMR
jgi:hypothetical protein